MSPTWDAVKAAQAAANEKAGAVREATWRAALVEHAGNVSRAAEALGFWRSYGSKLVKKFGLEEFVRELRRAAGQPIAGRPRSKKLP